MTRFDLEKLDTDSLEMSMADYRLEKINIIECENYYQIKLSDVSITTVSKMLIETDMTCFNMSFESAFKNVLLYQLLTKLENTVGKSGHKKTCLKCIKASV